jgi:tetratricopeptide (TPR) repeat protein
MELVQGVPITEYCDQCNLTTRERLALFITVCQAVQHAHQKGIIHRDIKPTNVLVAMQDGKATPKIIDFGVAKAIGEQPLTDRTLTTAFAQMVGTPMYMSPEQAELSPLGVDTRSDIYSLGVLLYELLTGATPFDKDRLHAASYDELRRIIREEEPPRPSARLSSLSLGSKTRRGEERAGVRVKNSLPLGERAGERVTAGATQNANLATTIATHRRTDPRRLVQTVRGELDWIVMKCLEKDRNRRYETPNSLARDIERYLHDEPVQACPPTVAYRFRKFARRNKTLLAAGGAISAALVIGLGLSTWMYLREREALQQARAALQYAEAWQLTVEAIGQLHVGDQAAYRATCKAIVELPVADLDDETKSRQIYAWTIAPDALEDTSFVVKRAEELAANNSLRQHHLALYGLGAALYRDGQYDRAADELKKSIAAYPTNPARGYEVINFQRLMLAMSQWQQGKKDEARRLLAETKPAVDQEIQSPSTYFSLKSTLELLRREAETLIEPKEANEAVENNVKSSSGVEE